MKKLIYEELWIITCMLLGILIGGLVEYIFLMHGPLTFSRYYIYIPLMMIGYVFGMWVGPIFWKKIYVDGTRGQKYVVKG
jgi:ACR3 family arsenite efflux pump ArsB